MLCARSAEVKLADHNWNSLGPRHVIMFIIIVDWGSRAAVGKRDVGRKAERGKVHSYAMEGDWGRR